MSQPGIKLQTTSLLDLQSILRDGVEFLRLLPTPRTFLASWGLHLNQWQQSAYSAITNRFAPSTNGDGFGAQDPSALYYEFDLPPHPVFLANKWLHSRERGTKQGLFRMLSMVGHTCCSVYTPGGRVDSNQMVSDALTNFAAFPSPVYSPPTNAQPADLLARYSSASNLVPTLPLSAGGFEWWTLVVWDYTDTTMSAGATIGTRTYGPSSDVIGSMPMGWFVSGQPTWAHAPQSDQILVENIARYHRCANELLLEVIYVYPNTNGSNGITAQAINSDGTPWNSDPVHGPFPNQSACVSYRYIDLGLAKGLT
jgi:hypothetical protein